MPPAHAGTASPSPAASFSLMVPRPLRPHSKRAPERTIATWRALTGICRTSLPYVMKFSRRVRDRLHNGIRCRWRFAALMRTSVYPLKPKIAFMELKVSNYHQRHSLKIGSAGFLIGCPGQIRPSVAIDNLARFRRHAAPIHGRKISAMVRRGPGTRFETGNRSGGERSC
jgi:hypothetical protein